MPDTPKVPVWSTCGLKAIKWRIDDETHQQCTKVANRRWNWRNRSDQRDWRGTTEMRSRAVADADARGSGTLACTRRVTLGPQIRTKTATRRYDDKPARLRWHRLVA